MKTFKAFGIFNGKSTFRLIKERNPVRALKAAIKKGLAVHTVREVVKTN